MPPLPLSRGSKGSLAGVATQRKINQQRAGSEHVGHLHADGRGLRGIVPNMSVPSEHLQPGVGINRSLLADSWVALNRWWTSVDCEAMCICNVTFLLFLLPWPFFSLKNQVSVRIISSVVLGDVTSRQPSSIRLKSHN